MMLWPLIAISPIASGAGSQPSTSSQVSGLEGTSSARPGTGIPIEPTANARPLTVRTTQPATSRTVRSLRGSSRRTFFSKSLCTSTGRADPPATATRRFALILPTSTGKKEASFSAPRKAEYIVGTRRRIVIPRSASAAGPGPARTGAASRRSRRNRRTVLDHDLAERVEQRQHAQEGVRVLPVAPNSVSPSCALSRMLRCRSSAPLGWPVVPDV